MDINININYNSKRKSIKIDFVLLAILALAAFLRLYHLGFQSAWLDEIHTLIESNPKLTFKEFDDIIMQREGIPHFYFLTIRFLSELFGHGIIIARMVSVVAGVLSVYTIYLLAKELLSKRAGYIAALLLTVSFFHIEHSQEARSYALLVFFVIVSYYRLLLLIKHPNFINAIGLGISAGLITNAHPIGLLNVASLYFALFIILLLNGNKQQKIQLFKFSFISGIVALLVFYPVYQIVSKVSDIQAFWIPEASWETIKQAFIDLLGRSEILALFSILLLTCYIGLVVFKLFVDKSNVTDEQKKLKTGIILLSVWFLINIGVIIIKSYTGISIILSRYFIGVLPAFILSAALVLALISNKIIRYIVVFSVLVFSLYNIFIVRKYYTEISKAQFDKVTSEIIKRNTSDNKVFSAYGWLMSYYINSENTKNIITEIKLEDYITAVRNDAVKSESFWYMDGNSRPYSLSKEDQDYLEQNYVLDQNIEMYDTWARHYRVKTEEAGKNEVSHDDLELYINEFMPFIQDGSGNLMLFENGEVKSPMINLEKGKYALIIKGNSLPEKPIQGQNAHLIVKINGEEIGNYYLSEKINNSEKRLEFVNTGNKKITISLVFDNDLAAGKLDRNVVLYSVNLKKIKE